MATINTRFPFVGSIETRQGGREENQDNAGFVDSPLGLLVVVCDGMGGGPGGRTASHTAINAILDVLGSVAEHTPRQDALRYAIEKANDAIYSKAKETPELQGMGTTVAAISINEHSAVIAHVGDSRVYQLRKGTVVYRSADHSLVANLVRENKLTEEEARNHPRANVITRALGIRPEIEAEFDEVAFLRGDRFVLCTDGIWGAMPQPELVGNFSRVMGIEELTATTADEIDQMGFQAGGTHDNLTLALLDVSFDAKKTNTAFKKKYRNIMAGLILASVICLFAIIPAFFNHADKQTNATTNIAAENNRQKGNVEEPNVRHYESSPPPSPYANREKDSCHARKTTNKLQPPSVIEDATNLKNAKTTRLIKQINNNMETLKNKKRRVRKSYVQNHISPHVKTLSEVMEDEKQMQVQALLQQTDINYKVKVTRKRGRGARVEEIAWYNNDSSINNVIQKLKDLEN